MAAVHLQSPRTNMEHYCVILVRLRASVTCRLAHSGKVRLISCACGEPLVKGSERFLARYFAGITIKFLLGRRRFLRRLRIGHPREEGRLDRGIYASWARW